MRLAAKKRLPNKHRAPSLLPVPHHQSIQPAQPLHPNPVSARGNIRQLRNAHEMPLVPHAINAQRGNRNYSNRRQSKAPHRGQTGIRLAQQRHPQSQKPNRRQPTQAKAIGPAQLPQHHRHRKTGGKHRHQTHYNPGPQVRRNPRKHSARKHRHKKSKHRKHREESKHAGQNHGQRMNSCKSREENKLRLSRSHRQRKQHRRRRIHVHRNQPRQKHDCHKIRERNRPPRNRQRHQVKIVPPVGKNAVPPPHRNRARHHHRQHNKKIFVRQRRGHNIRIHHSPHPLQHRSILREQQHRHKSSGQRQQSEHQPHAQIQPVGVTVSAAAKNARREKPNQPRQRTPPPFRPPSLHLVCDPIPHAAFITATISCATRTVSTSSTKRKNESSSDSPTICGMRSTESCAITVPLRKISTSEQTFSTTSSTCEQ